MESLCFYHAGMTASTYDCSIHDSCLAVGSILGRPLLHSSVVSSPFGRGHHILQRLKEKQFAKYCGS